MNLRTDMERDEMDTNPPAGPENGSFRVVSRLRRIRGIIGTSVVYGGLLGVLAYAVDPQFRLLESIPAGVAFAFVFGAFVGVLCSPFVVGALAGRDTRAARPIILWSAATIVALLSLALPENSVFVLMALSGVGFVGVSLVARAALPRIWDTPGLCRRCGYDIRASIPFNRCPECGTRLDEDLRPFQTDEEGGPRGRLGRTGLFFLRWPAVPLLLLIPCLIGPRLVRDSLREARTRALMSAMDRAISTGVAFDLTKSATFDWNEVYIFPPYTPGSAVRQTLPFSWPEIDRVGWAQEGKYLLVFARDQSVVEWVMLRPWPNHPNLTWASGFRGFADSCCGRPIRRDRAVFDVMMTPEGLKRIVQLGAEGAALE